jgi:hypothetical protein
MTWMLFIGWDSVLGRLGRLGMVAVGLLILAHYLRRVIATYRADIVNYERMTGKPLWYPPYRLP